MKKLILQDDKERNCEVDDPHLFQKHLFDFHTLNGKAECSTHEENGFYFIVTSEILQIAIKSRL